MSRLKELLAERKREKAQADTQTTEVRAEEQSSVPTLIIVPAWDYPTEDRFSPFF